jgi:hypothetical protein
MPVRSIPKSLTVADWNNKKGVIAKMAGETGIGAALTKLKTAWDKVDWDELDPDAAVVKNSKTGKMTVDLLDKLYPIAKQNYGKVEPVRKEFLAVSKLTQTIATKWKASKIIPSSSRKHVETMHDEADQMYIGLKSIDNDWKNARDRVEKEEERLKGIALNTIKPYFKSLRDYGQKVKDAPTVDNYIGKAKEGFHQNIRGLNAALDRSKRPDWIDWKDKNWKPLAQDSYRPTENSQVAGKVDKVLEVMGELEKLINKG